MIEQLGDAVSTYTSLKEALPEPRFGELPKKPRGSYAHFLLTLAVAFLFVEGLSHWETHRAFAVAMIAASVLIGVVVLLVGIFGRRTESKNHPPASENATKPAGENEHGVQNNVQFFEKEETYRY